MRWRDYWKDKALFLIFVGCCMAVTCIFLRLTGYEKGNVILDITFAVLDVPGIYGTQEIFQKDSRNFG